MRVLVGIGQTLFRESPVDRLATALCEALERVGAECEIARFPWLCGEPRDALRQLVAYRSLRIDETVDAFLALEPPALFVRHPRKLVWLAHLRGGPGGRRACIEAGGIRRDWRDACRRALRQESRWVGTVSSTASLELHRETGMEALPVSPPLPLGFSSRYPAGEDGLLVSLDPIGARIDLVIEALLRTRSEIPVHFAGTTEQCRTVRRRAELSGLRHPVSTSAEASGRESRFRPFVALFADRDTMLPWDAREAAASTIVLACHDSGAVAELVADLGIGTLVEPRPDAIAGALEQAWATPGAPRHEAARTGTDPEALEAEWRRVLSGMIEEIHR